MSIKINGELKYIIEGQDETQTHDTTNIKRTVDFEEYSKAQFKEDTTQYRTVHELDTEEGKFKWETIISISMDGITRETELIEQPNGIEIIQDFNFDEDDEDDEDDELI